MPGDTWGEPGLVLDKPDLASSGFQESLANCGQTCGMDELFVKWRSQM